MTERARLYLREWRKHRRLTQQQLSRKSGIRQAKISELETAVAKYWTPDQFTALAAALKCEPWQLLRGPKR